MTGKGRGRRRSEQRKERRDRKKDDGDSSGDDEEEQEEEEGEQPPAKFVLPGDDTGVGIDRAILDEESWQTLQLYCKVGLKYTGTIFATPFLFAPPVVVVSLAAVNIAGALSSFLRQTLPL